jgi:hypothetical protein
MSIEYPIVDVADVPRRKLVTAVWDLNSRGNGVVKYHQFRLPGNGACVWPETLPGAACERRERGGAGRASERKASSLYSYDPLPVGAVQIVITVSYSRGEKSGSSRKELTLTRYERRDDGEIKSVWETRS